MSGSLEVYFLANFAVDTILLAAVARINGCACKRRIALGGFLSSSYALIVRMCSWKFAHPLIQLSLLPLMSMILCADPDVRRWSRISLHLAGGAMVPGGICLAANGCRDVFSPSMIVQGIALLYLMLKGRNRCTSLWEIHICVLHCGKTAVFPALIDTGNRLREPFSGLPVMLAEESLLRDFFQPGETRFRSIAFGGVGGHGIIQCFRPESVSICSGDKIKPAPDVWIAVYPGEIPGKYRALAPPEFAFPD